MKPLIILLIVFTVSLPVTKMLYGSYKYALSARIAMSLMLLFTAAGHFAFTEGMSMMIPGIIPYRNEIVYLTGVFEIILAFGLLFPSYRIQAGRILIIFLILMLPANIYAAMHHVNYQTASYDGEGSNYLWFRIPLQLFFICWTYLSAVRH